MQQALHVAANFLLHAWILHCLTELYNKFINFSSSFIDMHSILRYIHIYFMQPMWYCHDLWFVLMNFICDSTLVSTLPQSSLYAQPLKGKDFQAIIHMF